MTRSGNPRSAGRRLGQLAAAAVFLFAAPLAAEDVSFRPFAVVVDSGSAPLAAYQVEVRAGRGASIAGIEGGEHAAFREPPYYDPAALRTGRIVLAAFSTAPALPSGASRVATLHMQLTGAEVPEMKTRLIVAATAGGARIRATVLLRPLAPQPGGTPRQTRRGEEE